MRKPSDHILKQPYFALLLLLALPALGQQSLQHYAPRVTYQQGRYLMQEKLYSGARHNLARYLATTDTVYRQQAAIYSGISSLKLYNLDGEKMLQDFVTAQPLSPLSSRAWLDMGEYFFQDRNYKKAATYLSRAELRSLPAAKRTEVQYKLGYSYFAIKQFDKALTQFNRVKRSTSSFKAPAHYYAGFVEYDRGDYTAALADFKAVAAEKAFAAAVPYMITAIYYKSGRYDDLIDYTRPLLDSKQRLAQRGQMAVLLAEAYFAKGQYDEAWHYFGLARKTEKFTAQSVYHYGVAAARTGKTAQAIDLLKSIAGQDNRVGALASYELGKLYLQAGNPEFAFTAFKNVKNSDHLPAVKADAWLMAGKLAYDIGRFSESIALLTAYKEAYPQYRTTLADEILAQAFLHTRNYKPALDYIEQLDNKTDNIWRAYQTATLYYGVDLYNDRQFSKAVLYFTKSLEHPVDRQLAVKANLYTAEAYSLQRQYKKALPYYEAAWQMAGPDNADRLLILYGRGYAYYNTGEYRKALPDFKEVVNKDDKKSSRYGDALVRLADCYYITRQYQTALNYFNQAIRGVVNEKDYAYYQAGVIYGLLDKYRQALDHLDRVINVYKNSAFYDDALFEKGLLQLKMEHFEQALATFDRLIREKPRSPYVPHALERSAVAWFNLGDYDKTISYYRQLIDKYPQNPGINDALIGLQEAMRLAGRASEFESLLAEFRQKNPEVSGLEKVEFENLRGYYNDQEYERAASGLLRFLEAYPDDLHAAEARYLLAESLYRLNRTDSALHIYQRLYTTGGDLPLHRIAERMADIELAADRYAEAARYYHELYRVAVSNSQQLRALMGLLKAHYGNAAYDSTLYYAERVMQAAHDRSDYLTKAGLLKGQALMNLGRFEEALLQFEETAGMGMDANAAAAQYYIGLILHQQGDYANSNEALYVIPEKFAIFTEWLDKAFLLVADNFIAMQEYFQAKATLQSIIDNSESANTVAAAEERLAKVLELEARENDIVPDSLNTVELDTANHENK